NQPITGECQTGETPCKTVQPISQVDCIAHADNDQHGDGDDPRPNLEKVGKARNTHIIPMRRAEIDDQCQNSGEKHLKAAFHAGTHPLAASPYPFDPLPVVNSAQNSVRTKTEDVN